MVKAWDMTGQLMGRLIEKTPLSFAGEISVKVIVQGEGDFRKGWLGEEILVDEILLRDIAAQGRVKYLLQRLFPKLQKVLRSPVFHPGSTFRLYYGSSSVYMIRLVVVPPAGLARRHTDTAGIEFTLDSLDGFSPSLG